jgi:energy-coupling factor transporter ATP-binding protein EcfA2
MIEVENLSKPYGEKLAVAGLDLAVQPGIVTGFLGPNGAGKSTTMRVIPGLDAADAHSVCRQEQPAGRCLPWPGDRTLGTTQPPQARTREAASHWRPPSPPMQNKRKEQEHGPMITTALVAHRAAAAGARKLTPAQLTGDDAGAGRCSPPACSDRMRQAPALWRRRSGSPCSSLVPMAALAGWRRSSATTRRRPRRGCAGSARC